MTVRAMFLMLARSTAQAREHRICLLAALVMNLGAEPQKKSGPHPQAGLLLRNVN